MEIYQAENLIDGHVVKGLLEQHGIAVEMLGADLAGGAGELPAFGLVRLAVDPLDVPRAEQLLAAYRSGELSCD